MEPSELEFQQAVGTVKALMTEIGIDVPTKVDMPKSVSEAHAILDGLPNIRNTRDARVLEKQLRILLFVAFAAKQFKSSEIVARLLQEVLNVRAVISQPAGTVTSNVPPMSSEDLCIMIFRMLFSEARLVNQMVMNHYKTNEQMELYQCCQRQNVSLKEMQTVMEEKFNTAFHSGDLITLEQVVRGALEELNAKTLCNDQTTIQDPNLTARIQKLASRIIGSIYYLKNHERAIQGIQTAYERGIAIRNPSDASVLQSRPERTPADQRQWQELNAGVSENLRRQAEVGQERAKRVAGGNQSRIPQPNQSTRSRTPDEQQGWANLQQVQNEKIRQHAQKGQDRKRRINEGPASRLPQPNQSERARTPQEQQDWDYRQQRQNDNIRKHALLGQERRQLIDEGPVSSTSQLNQSIRGRSAEEQQKWRERQMQQAESIRRDAEKGQQRLRKLEANASQSFANTMTEPSRRKTPEEQRTAQEYRQRTDERIRLEEEKGRERVRAINEGPRPSTPNVSRIDRTPAEQQKWEQLKLQHAESIRRNAEVGKGRKMKYEQGVDANANSSTAQVRRRRTPEEQEVANNYQERYAENIRLNEEIGRERVRAIERGPDTQRPTHNQTQREMTAEERRQWQALSQRADANIKKSAAQGKTRLVQYTQQVQTMTRSESFVQ